MRYVPRHLLRAEDDPVAVLDENFQPVILDEVQYVPGLLPYIKERGLEIRPCPRWTACPSPVSTPGAFAVEVECSLGRPTGGMQDGRNGAEPTTMPLLQALHQSIENRDGPQDLIPDDPDRWRAPEDPVSVGCQKKKMLPFRFLQGYTQGLRGSHT